MNNLIPEQRESRHSVKYQNILMGYFTSPSVFILILISFISLSCDCPKNKNVHLGTKAKIISYRNLTDKASIDDYFAIIGETLDLQNNRLLTIEESLRSHENDLMELHDCPNQITSILLSIRSLNKKNTFMLETMNEFREDIDSLNKRFANFHYQSLNNRILLLEESCKNAKLEIETLTRRNTEIEHENDSLRNEVRNGIGKLDDLILGLALIVLGVVFTGIWAYLKKMFLDKSELGA